MNKVLDILVIGGGHAGIEAAHAGAKLGVNTALMTMELDAIGRMSCNPAIGGVAKGQIVRDIDALGGVMGVLSDKAGIQFRMLNSSKGPAVWGPRAQEDMDLYSKHAREFLETLPGLEMIQDQAESLEPVQKEGEKTLFKIKGLNGEEYLTRKVIITSGTFLDAVMYTGMDPVSGGRIGESAAGELSKSLAALKIPLRRLKTGTPMRLDQDTVDFSETEIQYGDDNPVPFSFRTKHKLTNSATCWITRTNEKTSEILRSGFDRSPLFRGVIQGMGPRYCPSIEDKVSRFPDRDSHQLFLEPEGLDRGRIYINGFSSSLPAEIQEAAMRTIPGLANAKILQMGYAVEYDSVDANTLNAQLEFKNVPGLFFAGQVNGTSGYEEAAGQGLMAGLNAVAQVKEEEPIILGRSESYIGVMIDDLINLPIDEPYRMFTSRAEYRLFLRQDNAEKRLMGIGHKVGLVDQDVYDDFMAGEAKIASAKSSLEQFKLKPDKVNPSLLEIGQTPLKEGVRAMELLKRPGVELDWLLDHIELDHGLDERELLRFSAEELYAGFYERQKREIDRQKRMESMKIPKDFDYMQLESVSIEARQKLSEVRPMNLGQAQGIPGVRPVDISALIYFLENKNKT